MTANQINTTMSLSINLLCVALTQSRFTTSKGRLWPLDFNHRPTRNKTFMTREKRRKNTGNLRTSRKNKSMNRMIFHITFPDFCCGDCVCWLRLLAFHIDKSASNGSINTRHHFGGKWTAHTAFNNLLRRFLKALTISGEYSFRNYIT